MHPGRDGTSPGDAARTRVGLVLGRPSEAVSMNGVTQILCAIERGDAGAVERLWPLVYDELRQLAARRLAHEKPGQTLQATALVHEAYLRLVDGTEARAWESRRHFFAAAAEAMRRILVENARRKKRLRHGGGRRRGEFDENQLAIESPVADLIELDEALDQLSRVDQQAAELVKLRYFAGMTTEEAAEVLGLSARTAYRTWAFARAWLFRHIRHGERPSLP